MSSARHGITPWFIDNLVYTPPVHDFVDRGYPLLGGRIDYVGGRPVSALGYGRRQHVISVELWPKVGDTGRGPASQTRNGYHVLHWTTPEYSYWIVSDLGLPELQEFAQLLRAASD